MKNLSVQKNRKGGFLKFRFLLAPIIGLCLIGLITQCKKDSLLELENEALGFPKNAGSPLLTMDYEIESITRMSSDQNITEPIDIAAKTPTIDKQHVTMELYNDGTAKLTTVKMQPSQDFSVPHQVPEDYTPEIMKTVAYGDKIVYYDANDEILYTADKLPLPTFTNAVEKIQTLEADYTDTEVNEAITSLQNQIYSGALMDLIDSIDNYNGTVQNIDENLIRVDLPAYHYEPGNTDKTVLLIDKTRNLLLAARLYDEADNWKSSTMLRYSGGQNPVLAGMKTSVTDVLTSGVSITVQTSSTISNMNTSVSF